MPDPRLTFPYTSLGELVDAYHKHELDADSPLVINGEEVAVFRVSGQQADGTPLYEKVFDGGSPESLLEEALNLLEVPWKPAAV